MWYLPMVDRLRRLFVNPMDVAMMTWHMRKGDEKLRHPVDTTQWKNFDLKYRDFSEEPRNIRFALSTDGMNPFG